MDLFLSHATRDAALVDEVRSRFAAIGVIAYTTEHDNRAGENVHDKIVQAIRRCPVTVIPPRSGTAFDAPSKEGSGFLDAGPGANRREVSTGRRPSALRALDAPLPSDGSAGGQALARLRYVILGAAIASSRGLLSPGWRPGAGRVDVRRAPRCAAAAWPRWPVRSPRRPGHPASGSRQIRAVGRCRPTGW